MERRYVKNNNNRINTKSGASTIAKLLPIHLFDHITTLLFTECSAEQCFPIVFWYIRETHGKLIFLTVHFSIPIVFLYKKQIAPFEWSTNSV